MTTVDDEVDIRWTVVHLAGKCTCRGTIDLSNSSILDGCFSGGSFTGSFMADSKQSKKTTGASMPSERSVHDIFINIGEFSAKYEAAGTSVLMLDDGFDIEKYVCKTT